MSVERAGRAAPGLGSTRCISGAAVNAAATTPVVLPYHTSASLGEKHT